MRCPEDYVTFYWHWEYVCFFLVYLLLGYVYKDMYAVPFRRLSYPYLFFHVLTLSRCRSFRGHGLILSKSEHATFQDGRAISLSPSLLLCPVSGRASCFFLATPHCHNPLLLVGSNLWRRSLDHSGGWVILRLILPNFDFVSDRGNEVSKLSLLLWEI